MTGGPHLTEQELTPVTPEDRLEVQSVLTAWDGGATVGSIERLPGLTNRNFKASLGDRAVAVRLPGTGTSAYIDRDAELHNAAIASSLGIGAPILFAQRGALVTTFLEGRCLTPSIFRNEPTMAERAGRLLNRVHSAPVTFTTRFDPAAVIRAHRAGLTDVPVDADVAIARILDLEQPPQLAPCHNDPWPENFLDSGEELYLLDWEYSGMNDPAWDLADLIVEAELDAHAQDRVLAAYSGTHEDAALRSRVDALGAVTDLLWGLWALIQERDGNRAGDFATYGRRRLARAALSLH